MTEAKTEVERFSEGNKRMLKDQQSIRPFATEQLQGRSKKTDIDHELFTYPGFFVMPDCQRPDGSVVCPSNGVFQENCKSVEAFSEWWDANIVRETVIKPELFEYLVMR